MDKNVEDWAREKGTQALRPQDRVVYHALSPPMSEHPGMLGMGVPILLPRKMQAPSLSQGTLVQQHTKLT